VHSTLGEIVAGKTPGRISNEEIIIFDSTGMALQDVAASAIVYEKAVQKELGLEINLGSKSPGYEMDHKRATKN
jgi:ornithine cyclodeaminase/alanine dehydrogenase-like protein (mu-crystallin family)